MPDDVGLTFAIGDIHGCYEQLIVLLSELEDYACGRDYRLVVLGDMIDRGLRSAEVVALLRRLQADHPGRIVCLRGHHEEMMAQARRHSLTEPRWLTNGGRATLSSYGAASAAELPQDVAEWMAELPTFYRDRHRYFVHAGLDPARPLHQQLDKDRLSIRDAFLRSNIDFGAFVVHGHSPVHWRRGTVPRPDERAHRLNLDTGAVYGGALTAAVFDETRPGPLGFFQARQGGAVSFDVARAFQPPTVGAMARSTLGWAAGTSRGRLVASAALSGFFAVSALGAYRGTEPAPATVAHAEATPIREAAAGPKGGASLPQAGMLEPVQALAGTAFAAAEAEPRPASPSDLAEQGATAGLAPPLHSRAEPAAAPPVVEEVAAASPPGIDDDGATLAASSYDLLPAAPETLALAPAGPAPADGTADTRTAALGEEAAAPAAPAEAAGSPVPEPEPTPKPEDAIHGAPAPVVPDDGAMLAASSYDLFPAARDTLAQLGAPPETNAVASAETGLPEAAAPASKAAPDDLDTVASVRTDSGREAPAPPPAVDEAPQPPPQQATPPDLRRRAVVVRSARLAEGRTTPQRREARRKTIVALPSCAVVPSRTPCGRTVRTASRSRGGFWAMLLGGHEGRDLKGSSVLAESRSAGGSLGGSAGAASSRSSASVASSGGGSGSAGTTSAGPSSSGSPSGPSSGGSSGPSSGGSSAGSSGASGSSHGNAGGNGNGNNGNGGGNGNGNGNGGGNGNGKG